MRKYISLIGFLALVFTISAVGSYVTIPVVQQGGWYNEINKASWSPPSWVFGPVWTLLYIMIAISGWIIWRKLPTEKFSQKLTSVIMLPYWLQLLFNFLWSILFFGMHQPVFSLIDIVLLAATIGWNIGAFRKVSSTAAYLLVPYLLWVCYATSLNSAIVALN